jgi:murein DD-endopeptidase MepM/ murein hydrolase activator NlpD
MDNKKKDTRLKNKLRNKYRLIIYNDNTFEEVWFMKLSRLNILAWGGSSLIFFIVLLFIFIAYTPVREFIPGYPDGSMRRNIILNSLKVDSLEREIQLRDQYLFNLNAIIAGKEPESFENEIDTSVRYENISFKKSRYDSLFRAQFEQEEKFNVADKSNFPRNSIANVHFFTPVNGIVTNSFKDTENHFGTDIVAGPNEVVKATLDGTIILTSWTIETGNIVQIQHDNNLISVYKHNAEILKHMGNRVQAGEPIAIIGNSGELTTGPHLHFELWHKGKPVNPEEYITF